MQEPLIEGFRLSPTQRRLARLQRLDGAGVYLAQCALRIRGALRAGILRAAIEATVARHEILRTTFRKLAEMELPLQVICEGGIEWREQERCTAALNDAQLESLLNQEAEQTPVDLEHGPLLRASLFAIQDEEHLLVITLPALCADVATLRLLSAEVFSEYAASLGGEPHAAEAVQYADLSEWLNELLESEETLEGRAYWNAQEATVARRLRLPEERRGSDSAGPHTLCLSAMISSSLADGLKRLAHDSGCSMEALLLACWQTVLWRLSGERAFAISTAFDGRHYAEVERALGLYGRYLPLSTQLERGLSFIEMAQAMDAKLSEAREWQDYFIEESDLSSPAAGGDHSRIGFEYLAWPRSINIAGLSISFDKISSRHDRFALKLTCVHKESSILLEFHADEASLRPGAVERLSSYMQTLLASAVAEPRLAAGRLEMLSEAERHRLLIEFNDTERARPDAGSVHSQFERQVEMTPDAIAAVFKEQAVSFRELNARANQLAHYLQALRVGPEVLVAIHLERSLEMLTAMLAILKAGGAYLPLDTASPPERLSFMLEDAQVRVLLTQSKFKERIRTAARVLLIDSSSSSIGLHSRENPASAVAPENTAYVIYTSGSTGQPKGVCVPHSGLSNYLGWCAEAYDITAGQGAPVHSPLAFDLMVTSLFAPLLAGKRVVLLSEEEMAGEVLVTALKEQQDFSFVKLTPAHLELLGHALQGDEARRSTRALIVGGEALHAESLSFWRSHAPETRIINEYGPTETVVGCCVHEVQAETSGPVPIGRPIINTQLYILDEEMNPTPLLVAGELYIGGAGVARGYLNRPALTAERFVPDPFGPHAGLRLYRTGDLGRYRPDGVIEFLGRVDQQVKIKGYRVELGEIESLICEHHDVREAVVMLREESGDKRLVAYVVARDNLKLNEDHLRNHLQARVPEYMMPSFFVMLERLPLTPNGKVDREALPPPDRSTRESRDVYAAPRNRAEEILAAIWAEILGLEQVGINDNFFALGGDSIRGIQAIARANRAGIQLTTHQLFQNQTIARLAAVAGSVPTVQTEQGIVCGSVSLTPIQCWFFEKDLPEPHRFTQSVLLESSRHLDFSLLEKAVRHLLLHHDSLRLRFARTESAWEQFYGSADERAPVFQFSLAARTSQEYLTAIEETLAGSEARLNLSEGPVLRFTLFHSTAGLPTYLHVTIHHLVVDGVSWRILLEDLQLCYEQCARDESVQLPPKTTSYQYWSRQLSDYAQSETLRQEAAYWITETERFDAPLPLDFTRETGQSETVNAARSISQSLSAEETRSLLYDAPQSYRVEINDLLLTALGRAFAFWTKRNSVLICLEGHGRQDIFADVDLSRTVGWFTALFPFRLELPGGSDAGQDLKAVKEQLRRVPYHGLGYGLLRYLNRDESLSRKLASLPQPEVLFNYFGNLDHVLPASSLFSLRRETMEAGRDFAAGGREFLLEINAYVLDGRLTSNWTYSENLHRRETIETLAAAFNESLRRLTDYCLTVETSGYTPSDFPKSRLNQAELDHLLAKLTAARREQA